MGTRRFRVLVPVDFSEGSVRALDFALEWDRAVPCDLHLVHVIEDGLRDPMTGALAHSLVELRRVVEREIHRFAGARAEGDQLAAIERHVAVGAPAEEILRTANRLGIDLIVMGSQGITGVAAVLMGSVAAKVSRRALCPVLCVRPAERPTSPGAARRIVCPIDFSEPAHAAMLAASDLAAQLHVELLLLHVHPTAAPPEVDERTRLEGMLAGWKRQAEHAGATEVSTALVHGQPGDEIVGVVRDDGSDLLVLGIHGGSDILALLMGSVARTVLRRAQCPVLTVHPANEGRVFHDAAT